LAQPSLTVTASSGGAPSAVLPVAADDNVANFKGALVAAARRWPRLIAHKPVRRVRRRNAPAENATIVPAHQHSAGPKKDGAQAISRSRGGLTTKIRALVDALGNPVEVMLSLGQDHDLTCAERLIEAVDPCALIADKAFDADAFIAALNGWRVDSASQIGHFYGDVGYQANGSESQLQLTAWNT
jgi:hypothetical protein